jgi:ABC-type multidrug transport system fused ATPase/permease subunit
MVMLLRLVEAEAGSIFLGGKNLRDVDLFAVRRAVAMIPQEPFLMQGSVRQNLDPFGERSEEDISSALERVGLKYGLDDPVTGGGANLSAGERQLLSFSRILLRDAKVILLDEPTSSLDPMTDAKIGELMRHACSGRTVLTIAHRLKTVADSDIIVVLGSGAILESGSPQELLRKPDSHYARMLQLAGEEAGEKNAQNEKDPTSPIQNVGNGIYEVSL